MLYYLNMNANNDIINRIAKHREISLGLDLKLEYFNLLVYPLWFHQVQVMMPISVPFSYFVLSGFADYEILSSVYFH